MNKEDIEKIKVLNSAMWQIVKGKFNSSELRKLSLNKDDPFYKLHQNILKASRKLDESSHFVKDLGNGKLNTIVPNNNFIISYFKELHSDLKHLIWQIKEITKGDYSQTVYLKVIYEFSYWPRIYKPFYSIIFSCNYSPL